MKNDVFKLNKELHVSNKGHILYLYETHASYIANVCEFILSGIHLHQSVLIVDTEENCGHIKSHLVKQGVDLQDQEVYFQISTKFYMENKTFCCESIVAHFQTAVESFIADGKQIRTWGNVKWLPLEDILRELVYFETVADQAIQESELLSVCAYDAEILPASIALKLKRSHGYVMTDTEFFVSSLYAQKHQPVIFPSLSEQHRIQSEMDLYKQKLDFAHVVSHEVRNPLTVIKAYCSIMLHNSESISQDVSYKLSEIKDYVDIIDQELTHIIHTEQMLSNEHLWKKDWLSPLPVLEDVIKFMAIKAKSQNQQLEYTISVPETQLMFASKVGLKLIISNLLSNAIKYNEEGNVVSFLATVENDSLYLRFEDHGMGMETSHLENLFVKYSKLNHDKAGQGIGLYMVKKLLDDTGGTIHFESTVGQGTIVHVKIALVDVLTNAN